MQFLILSDNLFRILETINNVYENGQKGCLSIEITASLKELKSLEKLGFIFRNTETGWFPSTKGQQYVRELREQQF